MTCENFHGYFPGRNTRGVRLVLRRILWIHNSNTLLRSTFVLGLFRGKALRLVAEVCGCKLTQCESRLDGRMLQYPVLLEAIVMHSRT